MLSLQRCQRRRQKHSIILTILYVIAHCVDAGRRPRFRPKTLHPEVVSSCIARGCAGISVQGS